MTDKKSRNQKKDSSREKIAIEEADLWKSIAGTVRPIESESKNRIRHSDLPEIEEKKSPKLPGKKSEIPDQQTKAANQDQGKTRNKGSQLTGIDRRSKQKLVRGNVAIDARIDLHGASQIEARTKLKSFLLTAQQRGDEFVLVITGKGTNPYTRHMLHGHEDYSAPEREGVLRRSLPGWMNEKEFSDLVSGFQPAHPKHGGGGAFYLKLRRRKNKK